MNIYIVERGVMMNGWEWEFDEKYRASTFEKANAYINKQENKKCRMIKVNPNYWKFQEDHDFAWGIMKEELDKDFE